MEKLDQDLQKRVWERVQNRTQVNMPTLERANLKPWVLAARENAAAYRALGEKLPGQQARLRQLEQQAMSCAACLRGICVLRGEQGKLPAPQIPKDQPRRMLEKCYHRERRLCEEAQRRAADPEHGIVFRSIARQGEERCAILAELLGKME